MPDFYDILKEFGLIGLLVSMGIYIILNGRLKIEIEFPRKNPKQKISDD